MNNFSYQCSTKLIFGRGQISHLEQELKKYVNDGDEVMMLYGQGSIKRHGVYDDVMKQIKRFNVIEFGGIEPNPEFSTCVRAADIAKNRKIKFLLSVGGGSSLDATKFIALARYCDDEKQMLDILRKRRVPQMAMAIGSVMTLSATGSEMNPYFVISVSETSEKLDCESSLVYPKFSIVDPTYTITLPMKQTINGVVDAFAHVVEQYATVDINTPLQDLMSLSVLRVLVSEGGKIVDDPNDYCTRANISLCAIFGLNNLISLGVIQDWATHAMGHELTAFYGLDHAQSLAVILPNLLKNQIKSKNDKLCRMGTEVFGLDCNADEMAAETVKNIESFFNKIGMPTRLKDYGIDSTEASKLVANRFKERRVTIGENGFDYKTCEEILLNC